MSSTEAEEKFLAQGDVATEQQDHEEEVEDEELHHDRHKRKRSEDEVEEEKAAPAPSAAAATPAPAPAPAPVSSATALASAANATAAVAPSAVLTSSNDGDNALKKRKFADKFSTDQGLFLVSQSEDSMLFDIVPKKVGHILGSKGMIIVELGKRSGAKINVNQDFPPGHLRQVIITGTKEQMEVAADLIKRIVDLGPTGIHENTISGGSIITKMIECTQAQVGKVIGTGGNNIREIQSQSGARIQIHQNFPIGVPRQVEIVGTQVAIDSAEVLIRNLMASAGVANVGGEQHRSGGFNNNNNNNNNNNQFQFQNQYPNRPNVPQHQPFQQQAPIQHQHQGFPNNMQYGFGGPSPNGEVNHCVEVARTIVARIIGKNAENLQMIQRRSGCRVYVDQSTPEGRPCKVNITGIPHNMNIAVLLLQEIQAGVHTSKIGATLPAPIVGAPSIAPPNLFGAGPTPYGSVPPYTMDPYAGGYAPYQQQPTYPNPYSAGGYEGYGAQPYVRQPTTSYGGQSIGYGAAVAPKVPVAPPAPAPQPPKPPASEWSEYKTEDGGIPYWYNSRTRESQWTRPPGF